MYRKLESRDSLEVAPGSTLTIMCAGERPSATHHRVSSPTRLVSSRNGLGASPSVFIRRVLHARSPEQRRPRIDLSRHRAICACNDSCSSGYRYSPAFPASEPHSPARDRCNRRFRRARVSRRTTCSPTLDPGWVGSAGIAADFDGDLTGRRDAFAGAPIARADRGRVLGAANSLEVAPGTRGARKSARTCRLLRSTKGSQRGRRFWAKQGPPSSRFGDASGRAGLAALHSGSRSLWLCRLASHGGRMFPMPGSLRSAHAGRGTVTRC